MWTFVLAHVKCEDKVTCSVAHVKSEDSFSLLFKVDMFVYCFPTRQWSILFGHCCASTIVVTCDVNTASC